MERLDKFLCAAGIATRSQVKGILKSGRVTVDGVCQRDGSCKIDSDSQVVCLDGERVGQTGTVVAMLNKPAGYVTATEDALNPTVMELLGPELRAREVKPVGRLDKDTEGLLLFTNDGELLHRLISPKKEVSKIYYAKHAGTAGEEDVKAFADKLVLRDGTVCRPALLEPLGPGESLITVCEGKYHQVRRMMAARGLHVTYLQRRQEGDLPLGDLPLGHVRLLDEHDIALLLK